MTITDLYTFHNTEGLGVDMSEADVLDAEADMPSMPITIEILPPVTDAVVCVHHWAIESPNGPQSQGTCRKCGMTKLFNNTSGQTYTETYR